MNFKEFKKNYQVKKVQEFFNSVSSLPCLSICIQTYEHVSFIRQCLEGLLLQKTTFPFEILLGDDGSTDGTRELCIAYAEKYPNKIRLFLHHRENNIKVNGSPTGRFNFLYNLYNARGKYIALCEGDDYWTDPLKLQKQVDFLERQSDYIGCFHYTQTIKENGELGRVFGLHSNKIDFVALDTFSSLALFHTSSLVFLRSAFIIPVWFTKVVSGDMALFSIIAAKGKLRCLPEIMSVYRKHKGGITNSPYVLNNYHTQRIRLIHYLNEFHNYKYQKAANVIIKGHRKYINPKSKKIGLFHKIIQKAKKIIYG
jgi:glycosyltransferase involved in cell wall biosynthesis